MSDVMDSRDLPRTGDSEERELFVSGQPLDEAAAREGIDEAGVEDLAEDDSPEAHPDISDDPWDLDDLLPLIEGVDPDDIDPDTEDES